MAISDELGDKKLVGYYDIDAFVTNDGEFIDLVNDITPVEVLLDMPSDLPELKAGFVRKFYLIRYHNGETTTIEAYEKDGKIRTSMATYPWGIILIDKLKAGDFNKKLLDKKPLAPQKSSDDSIFTTVPDSETPFN